MDADVSLAEASAPRAGLLRHLLAVLLALLGGAFGIVGAFVQEVRAGGGVLLPFIGAPIIEEALKPLGVYLVLARWPHVLRGRLHTALLTALAGLTFGAIESAVYVGIYVSDASGSFVLYRFTVPLMVHSAASFTVGLGLGRGLLDWAAGRGRLPRAARNFYLAGVVLHAAYNLTAAALTIAGVLDLE